jgi:hypothetical protein
MGKVEGMDPTKFFTFGCNVTNNIWSTTSTASTPSTFIISFSLERKK